MQLNYLEFGEENKHVQSLIILHGLFGSNRNWQSIAKQLANTFHVITVDLRNHGQSPHDEAMDYLLMAEDVSDLISSMQLDAPVLIGHSMGGKVAMSLALQELVTLKSLIVLDIAPVNYQHNFDVVLNAMASLPLASLQSRQQADDYMAAQINNPELRLFLLHNLRNNQGHYEWQLNLNTIQASMDNIIGFPAVLASKTNSTSAFFLAGALSDYVQTEHHQTIQQYFPNAIIDYIDKAGHWLHAEQPQKVITAIENFIVNQ